MAKRFRGEATNKVDGKGRVSVPAPFRRVLQEGDPDWTSGAQPQFILIYGLTRKPVLEGYTVEGADRLDARIAAMPFGPERELLERIFQTQSVDVAMDENGRMVLSQFLRDRIGLTGEAKFAGMGEKFQIWEPGAYDADMARIAAAAPDIDPMTLLNG